MSQGKIKGDLIKIDGTVLDKNGKEINKKSDFFKFLEIENAERYKDLKLTVDEAMKLRNRTISMRYGTSSGIPMICIGKKCIYKDCPLHEHGKYPLTKKCVLEESFIISRKRDYMEELDVDLDSMTDLSLVDELVVVDLILYRANSGLAGNLDPEDTTLLKTTLTVTDNSTTESVDAHPLLGIIENFQKTRRAILEALVATRREQYKQKAALGQKNQGKDSDAMAKIVDLADKIANMERNDQDQEAQDMKDELDEFNGILDVDFEEKG